MHKKFKEVFSLMAYIHTVGISESTMQFVLYERLKKSTSEKRTLERIQNPNKQFLGIFGQGAQGLTPNSFFFSLLFNLPIIDKFRIIVFKKPSLFLLILDAIDTFCIAASAKLLPAIIAYPHEVM